MAETLRKSNFGTFEIARLCQVSPASVNRWIKSGKVKASHTVGGHQRVAKEDLVQLLKDLRLPVPEELQINAPTKVLLIDDDATMRKLLRVFLEDHFDEIEIAEADDGFQAGIKLAAFRPDLVTLDIKMPGMDGFSVCSLIKSSSDYEHIKVVAVSGQSDDDSRSKMLAAGADAFLLKPLSQNDLRQKILDLYKNS